MDFNYEPNYKTTKFYEFLKSQILSGNFKPNDKFYSVRELVKLYDVGYVTASTVLSTLAREGLLYTIHGKGTFVSEYNNADKEFSFVGLILFDYKSYHDYEKLDIEIIQHKLRPNYYVIPYSVDNDIEKFYKALKGFVELDVEGIIATVPILDRYNTDYIKSILGDTPIVLQNRRIPNLETGFVGLDYEYAGYICTKHLIEKGRRKISFIGKLSDDASRAYYEGYKKALREYGEIYKEDLLIEIDSEMIFKREWNKILDFIKKRLSVIYKDIDGIIGNETLICGLIPFLNDLGLEIPQDISLVSIGNSWASQMMNPALTSLDYPRNKINELSAEALKRMIKNKGQDNYYENIIIKPQLIVRSSS